MIKVCNSCTVAVWKSPAAEQTPSDLNQNVDFETKTLKLCRFPQWFKMHVWGKCLNSKKFFLKTLLHCWVTCLHFSWYLCQKSVTLKWHWLNTFFLACSTKFIPALWKPFHSPYPFNLSLLRGRTAKQADLRLTVIVFTVSSLHRYNFVCKILNFVVSFLYK